MPTVGVNGLTTQNRNNDMILLHNIQRESKNTLCGFLTFFPKRMEIFNQFLHTY